MQFNKINTISRKNGKHEGKKYAKHKFKWNRKYNNVKKWKAQYSKLLYNKSSNLKGLHVLRFFASILEVVEQKNDASKTLHLHVQ